MTFRPIYGGTVTKGDRLVMKIERREAKAIRKAQRQAEHAARLAMGIKGAPIAEDTMRPSHG
jgi:hypothetical protein